MLTRLLFGGSIVATRDSVSPAVEYYPITRELLVAINLMSREFRITRN